MNISLIFGVVIGRILGCSLQKTVTQHRIFGGELVEAESVKSIKETENGNY